MAGEDLRSIKKQLLIDNHMACMHRCLYPSFHMLLSFRVKACYIIYAKLYVNSGQMDRAKLILKDTLSKGIIQITSLETTVLWCMESGLCCTANRFLYLWRVGKLSKLQQTKCLVSICQLLRASLYSYHWHSYIQALVSCLCVTCVHWCITSNF